MSKDLFRGLLKPTAHLSRNGFDCSHKDVWSQKAGQLVPCFFQEMVKNDYVEIDLSSLMRTTPLQTAAFLRAKIKFDFYFVPYTQIWHGWDSFNADSDVRYSSAYKKPLYAPRFDLGFMTDWIDADLQELNDTTNKDIFNYPWAPNAMRLLDMCGYGAHPIRVNSDGTAMIADGYTTVPDGYEYSNLFRAAAYQLIWYHYYRNSYYDNTTDYLSYFNFDDLDTTSQAGATLGAGNTLRLRELFTMRYHQYNKDIFTGSLPSTQYGSVSSVPSSTLKEFFTNGTTTPAQGTVHSHQIFGKDSATDTAYLLNTQTNVDRAFNFDVLTLRKMQAIQGWKQNILRAGQNPQDRADAIYGERSKYVMDNFPDYLGTFDGSLSIDDVTQSSPTTINNETQQLGQLGGKGVGVISGNKIKYHTSDFGVIVGICSIVPKSEYNAQMIDKNNQLLDREDFFIPDYDNLGLEPVTAANLDRMTIAYENRNNVIGYAPRYWNYKTNVDKVHNSFMAYYYDPPTQTEDGEPGFVPGGYSHWVAPRADVQYMANNGLTIGQYYVNPNVLDTIFYAQAGNFDDTDNFIFNTYFEVKKVSPMSVLGIPQF